MIIKTRVFFADKNVEKTYEHLRGPLFLEHVQPALRRYSVELFSD